MIDKDREDRLVRENLGLVVSIARNSKPRSYQELQDYIQVGNMGLLNAIRKHKPQMAKLTTLAWYCINREILRYKNKESKYKFISLEGEPPYSENIERLWECLPDDITDVEKTILKLRQEGHSFESIANKVGFSRLRVTKILKGTLVKISDANT